MITKKFEPTALLAAIQRETTASPVAGATWYAADAVGDGLAYSFSAGTLSGMEYLSADMLLDGNHLTTFALHLQEGESGPKFGMIFGALNQCSARIRIVLDAVNQNRWCFEREGAWLKPMCTGDRVSLDKVDRMTFTVLRKSDLPVRWCITPLTATVAKPPRLAAPVLPKGPLLDELGQSTLHQWPAKSRDAAEVTLRLKKQLAEADGQHWPAHFSRWGGWLGKRFEATGYFHTHHDGKRWWLVDPDGHAFWSAGMDCVRFGIDAAYEGLETALTWLPPAEGEFAAAHAGLESAAEHRPRSVDYLKANFIRAFGAGQASKAWARIALGEIKRSGFNTVANWSDWQIARAAGFPYVRPLSLKFERTPMIFRDFPDVFAPSFDEDAREYALQLRETSEDRALIGYFLMNEPTWGFADQTPAEGMWLNTPSCATRTAFEKFVRSRHDGAPTAEDFTEFSSLMVEKLFKGLCDACRAVDPHHLNLGARYYTTPPKWALAGMGHFDVFSINCYQKRVWPDRVAEISGLLQRPVLVGEWHFGALDAGLPASGIGHVRTQAARGQAFRDYTENASALPGCVGVHYFTMYDQSALGRFDGENYNIGFIDIAHRPYEALADAARTAHGRMYAIAAGEAAPSDDRPEYLPLLFT